MSNNRGYRIAIVGGSLSGCLSSILLRRAGHDVRIFERSKRGLIGRGGGVTTTSTILNRLKDLEVIDRDFPSCRYEELQLSKASDESKTYGRCPLTRPLDMNCVHWSGLWENMRKRVDDKHYLRGMELTLAENRAGDVLLTFADGSSHQTDFVLFADGYNSLGRRIMFPEVELEYRGYSVWRGVVPESEIDADDMLRIHPRFSLKTQAGSFISYMIPSREGANGPGERQFNWACYLPVSNGELAAFMTDNLGQQRIGTIPAGSMRDNQDIALKSLMTRELPAFYSNIVARSRNNQLQQIYTNKLPAYRKGRMCLIGDAGVMVPPLTGAGLFKALTNAQELTEALAGEAPLEDALETWSVEQTRIADSILAMGLDMEKAFIWDTIDLASASPQECDSWMDQAITISKEYSYFAL